jgi:hypothetical protein
MVGSSKCIMAYTQRATNSAEGGATAVGALLRWAVCGAQLQPVHGLVLTHVALHELDIHHYPPWIAHGTDGDMKSHLGNCTNAAQTSTQGVACKKASVVLVDHLGTEASEAWSLSVDRLCQHGVLLL